MKHYIKTALVRVTTLFTLVIMLASQASATDYFVTTTGAGGGTGADWDNAYTLPNALAAVTTTGHNLMLKAGKYTAASAGQFRVRVYAATSPWPTIGIYGGFAGTEANLAARPADVTANQTVIDCAGFGYQMAVSNCNATIDGLRFINQVGSTTPARDLGAIWFTNSTTTVMNPVVRNCWFATNVIAINTTAGAGTAYSVGLLAENCVFESNTFTVVNQRGMNATANGTTRFCTFIRNGANHLYGGGTTARCNYYGCLFADTAGKASPSANWGFTNNFVRTDEVTMSAALRVGCVTNRFAGLTDNSVDNVKFLDYAAGDFRLQWSSPCTSNSYNSANTNGVGSYFPTKDMKGNTRANGTTTGNNAEYGAFEYVAPSSLLTNLVAKPDAGVDVKVNLVGGNYAQITNLFDSGAVVSMTSSLSSNAALTTRYTVTNWVDGSGNVTAGSSKSFTITQHTNWTVECKNEYKFTVLTNNNTFGTAAVASTWVTNGESASYSASANGGYGFSEWTEGGSQVSTANPYTFTATTPRVLTAVFIGLGEPVTVNSVPSGRSNRVDDVVQPSVTPYIASLSVGAHTLDLAATQTVDSVTEARFNNWNDGDVQGPCTTTNWTYTVSAGGATLTATFDLYYKLTVTTNNTSAGTATVGSPTGDSYYLNGANKTLTASANAGYIFLNWTGDIGSATATDAEITVPMGQGRSIQANFAKAYFVKMATSGDASGSSWANATTLSNALHQGSTIAGGGAYVYVQTGTYKPASIATNFMIWTNTYLYGGFAGTEASHMARPVNPALNRTIISGDANDNGANDVGVDHPRLMAVRGGNEIIDGITFQFATTNGAVSPAAGPNGAYALKFLAADALAQRTVRNCVFRDNNGPYGGCIQGYDTFTGDLNIENCLFYDNGNGEGSCVYYTRYNNTRVRNCVSYNNNGSAEGTWQMRGSTIYFYNTVFFEGLYGGTPAANIAYGLKLNGGALGGTWNCAFTNGWSSYFTTGQSEPVYTSDPLFVSAAAGDLRLASGSPCLDKGSNTLAVASDIRGAARPTAGTGAISDIGAYEMGTFYNNGLSTLPAGLNVVIDGAVKTTPQTVACEGLTAMSATTQTNGTLDSVYSFSYWTNTTSGAWSSANPYSFTITQNTNWVAVFTTQHKVTAVPNPANGGSVTTNPASGWVTEGANVTFEAFPDTGAGFSLTGWNDGAGQVSAANPYTFAVTGPTNLTAEFAASGIAITIEMSPKTDVGGIRFTVDGVEYTNEWTFTDWTAGQEKVIALVDAVQDWNDDGTGFVFAAWSDSGLRSHTYTVPSSDATVTATTTNMVQFKVTTAGAGSGTVDPVNNSWFAKDSTITATATATSGGFTGWSGDVSGSDKSVSVTMSSVKNAVANFGTMVYVKKNASGSNNGSSWANAYTELRTALSSTAAGAEFWVAAGSYSPSSATVEMTLQSGDAIYGGFVGTEDARGSRDWTQNVTIVTGDWTGDNVSDMTTAPLFMQAAGGSGTLDGFVFEYAKNTTAEGSTAKCGGVFGSASTTGGYIVRNSIFRYNTAASGPALRNNYGVSSLENCLFHHNTATEGSGMYGTVMNRRGSTALMNCTLADNTGIDVYSANDNGSNPYIYLTNCIARSAAQSVVRADPDDNGGVIDHSNVRGLAGVSYCAKISSVDEDPLLTSSYRLSFGSPSVDDGVATSTTMDLARRTRTLNGAPDLGCYEGTTLTVAVNPTTGASVTFNGVLYSAPALVGVEAGTYTASRTTPQAEGTTTQYVFSAWSLDGDTSTGPTRSVQVTTANRVLDVTFTKQFKLGLTITPAGYGTVANGTDGAWYDSGSVLSLNPSPVAGVVFSAWSVDLTGSSDPQNLTMDAAKNVTATFVADGPTAILFQ